MMAGLLFYFTAVLIFLLISYPLFSWIRAAAFPKPVKKNLSFRPPVSIIISCYNEERYIVERLKALLAPTDWIPGSEILVISTGSTDRTNELLKDYESHPAVRIFYETRITKIEALNWAVPQATNDFLVFSDCRQYMQPGSVPQMIANLADPDVGTVSCTILDTSQKPSFFRRLYRFLAIKDSASGSSLNLYGALYAQRKSVFREIPNHLLFDDFFVAVSTLAQKKRLVQETQAVLFDVPFPDYYNAERVERLARGLLIFLFNNFQLIRQIPFRVRMRLLIYKYLKLVLPLLLVMLLATALLMVSGSEIKTLLIVLTGALLPTLLIVGRSRRFVQFFLKINYYFLSALVGYLFLNRRSKYWQPLTIRRRWFSVRHLNQ